VADFNDKQTRVVLSIEFSLCPPWQNEWAERRGIASGHLKRSLTIWLLQEWHLVLNFEQCRVFRTQQCVRLILIVLQGS
jgi:hypothetical protein